MNRVTRAWSLALVEHGVTGDGTGTVQVTEKELVNLARRHWIMVTEDVCKLLAGMPGRLRQRHEFKADHAILRELERVVAESCQGPEQMVGMNVVPASALLTAISEALAQTALAGTAPLRMIHKAIKEQADQYTHDEQRSIAEVCMERVVNEVMPRIALWEESALKCNMKAQIEETVASGGAPGEKRIREGNSGRVEVPHGVRMKARAIQEAYGWMVCWKYVQHGEKCTEGCSRAPCAAMSAEQASKFTVAEEQAKRKG